VHIEVRKQAWNPLGKHRLSYAWWTVEQHVVSTGGGDLAGPLGLDLTHDICQVETTVRMLAGRLTDHVDGLNIRHWNAPQEGDQLGDRANTKDLDPLDQFRLTGLAQRNDHPRETRLLSRQRGGQDAAYGAEATVQPEFTQQ
jgi:hypothetical protein